MNRTSIASMFVCSLLLIQLHTQADAQEKTVTTQRPPQAAHARTLKWDKVEGASVLRIWQLEGKDSFPQVSIVRLSNADYVKFFQHPKEFMDFLNDKEIFSKKVIEVGPWTSLSSVEGTGAGGWTLTLMHGKVSTVIVSALPNFKSEKEDGGKVP